MMVLLMLILLNLLMSIVYFLCVGFVVSRCKIVVVFLMFRKFVIILVGIWLIMLIFFLVEVYLKVFKEIVLNFVDSIKV